MSKVEQPIAIVGMACRFPGAPDIPSFWRLLEGGKNAVIEGEPGSGKGRVGQLFPDPAVQSEACRFGAYLDEIDLFDAAFFHISPVEAQLLDPQQRLMLETSWRALEDAGMDPDRLKGSRTGVYAGISNNDYRSMVLDANRTAEPASSLYTLTGTSFNTAIGRVAYALGLEGPTLALDTACSSSLVAIHQAVSGLQHGEADLALAGGVHTILSGRLLELYANAGMLAPDGRCKTFDAAANGYVRSEGCGIVALKRLDEAEADGDRIWAIIRGSAINQDGASPGLTVPSGPAQEQVIEAALQRAQLQPVQVDYVECHGTGTPVGDPIEAQAVGTAYGNGRSADNPLLIGSVKTNFGHQESAAGVAAVIKVILAMQHGLIPRHLNFRNPSPAIDWESLPLRVTSEPTPWPVRADRKALAGISGFGWSGTNAHLIVEGYRTLDADPAGPDESRWAMGTAQRIDATLPEAVAGRSDTPEGITTRRIRFLPLSGRSDKALRELAQDHLDWIDRRAGGFSSGDTGEALLSDMAWTAGVGRSHFSHRAGVVFHDLPSLRENLAALAETGAGAGHEPGRQTGKLVFAFTGQASQWPGMGATLYQQEPVARAVLDRCDAVLRELRGASLLDIMFGRTRSEEELDNPAWTQPAIYALECALAAMWTSLGIRPDVIVGHSLGEIAAAQAAGVFDLEQGLLFAAQRGELMGALPGEGAMAAVFAPAPRVAAMVEEYTSTSPGAVVNIAADNGAHQAISGSRTDVGAVLERFEADGIRVARLRASPAYHSALVDPALDDLEQACAGMTFAVPSLPVVSSMTGRMVEPGATFDGAYWRRQAREPVAFRDAVETLAQLRVGTLIEIGPNAVLGPMTELAWSGPESSANKAGTGILSSPLVIASLLRPSSKISQAQAEEAFTAAAARAYEAGLPVSLAGLFAGESRRRISVPGYPFQRERFWIEALRRRQRDTGHPLLGERHESASGEVSFETKLFPSDPAWLNDHRVFERLVAPGALYGAMAATAALAESSETLVVEDMQFHNSMIFPEQDSGDEDGEQGRKVQVLLNRSGEGTTHRVQVLSKGGDREEWTLHAEGSIPSAAQDRQSTGQVDLEGLKKGLSLIDVPAFYQAKAGVGIDLGPSFRTLEKVWCRQGEALGEVTLPETLDRAGPDVHPLLLDGCFQVLAAACNPGGVDDGVTYLPFGWERLWLAQCVPERVFCHVRMKENPAGANDEPRETLSGDLHIYAPDGLLVGEFNGYTVKRATRAALLAAVEGLNELLYEITWRDRALAPGILPADFLPEPATVAAGSGPFTRYLEAESVGAEDRAALLADLEVLARSFALSTLDKLGWQRIAGARVEPEALRRQLQVREEHRKLFRRMLELLAGAGVLRADGDGFSVAVGSGDPLPGDLPGDPDEFAAGMAGRYPHGVNEIGLFRRSGGALAQVLLGREDPLTLLFGSGEPTAADLYLKAPVERAANRMLGDVIAALLGGMPDGRRLRVLEVGAGTGSATASVLPELPSGRFDYTYTDISAGFFSEAEGRFRGPEAAIDYRVLDIEKDPVEQGFDAHGYDLVIASSVLHATRYLNETLAHCLDVLAPSGHLVALENLRGQGWEDLTFGQLDGWWRFADDYRPHHALASPEVWLRALGDAGFTATEILGVDTSAAAGKPDRGVIVAQGPSRIAEERGVWVLAADCAGTAVALAAELTARNQAVMLAGGNEQPGAKPGQEQAGVIPVSLDMTNREAWRSLFQGLPQDVPLSGIIHLAALDGHGAQASTEEMAADVRRVTASALALVQGCADADVTPANGLWFVTRGGQVLEKERSGELAGATLWGFGKVVAREAAHLQARMIDLDPDTAALPAGLTEELLYPDAETHIAYRRGLRQAARLVRSGSGAERLPLPEGPDWILEPDPAGALERLDTRPTPRRALEPMEVRVAIEATGLNFWDVFRSIGFIPEGLLGGEMCGHVIETGSGVTNVAIGDRVVGLGFGTFAPEVITRAEMVAPAPPDMSVSALATLPTVFVSAALSYELAGLKAGDRVLIHAGAGGVGLAAIQLAHVAGAEVFTTASEPEQAYLRALGVKHVFDSRGTAFGQDILQATDGAGVEVVVNSLTGEGFIEASLSCLKQGGRFVELAWRDILSEEEMAALRPDVAYFILQLDVEKEHNPAWPGAALNKIMGQLATGEVTPLIHSRWPLAEARAAMRFMRSARHLGKIVFMNPPLMHGPLRPDRTYLVTGGLGGIGCLIAEWLTDRGAGAIVLNGRRDPDPAAQETIDGLIQRGATVRVELADVTDAGALDGMLARIDREMPPLGGVIHSVGVLSDGALGNQNPEKFEQVLGPKVLGAWHLHRATRQRDLDLFVLFSSVAGVMGNPGHSNHAAANAFLDQLAAHRRALGLPGQAIAWGAWSGLGEAEEQRERIARQLEASGSGWIDPQQGIRAFDRLVSRDIASATVVALDWQVFRDAVDNHPPLLEELISSTCDAGSDAADEPGDLLSGLRSAAVDERVKLLTSFLQREVQAVLRLPGAPEPAVGFFDLGMDSLMAVELRNRLNRAFAGEYTAPNTVVFDYPDITTLAAHLAGELGESSSEPAAPAQPEAQAQPAGKSGDNGIAIIGMACRFPGAPDLEAFWRLLDSGADAVTARRPASESLNDAYGNPSASDAAPQYGGFIEGIDLFDSRFFGISPIAARIMDPQQRLLLETSWLALEDAGMDPERLRGSRTGVYAGIASSEYRDLMANHDYGVNYLGTDSSMAVGRVSYQFGLEGPTLPVMLNCASSLVATHHAVMGLQREEADVALVGGVNVILSHQITREMKEIGMLSPQGTCRAFDAAADGAVRSEGCGMMVLKRLADAESDGDRIWGVIRGSAINQSGASAGPTAAKGPAQEQVIEAALARAGVAPDEVDYLEAHGAGSELGDPIEVQAAAAVYGRERAADRPLLIGSVKTNFGHLEAAAGAASLIKTVLAMNRGLIPKQLHFENPTPHLDWERLPVRVTSKPMNWPDHPGRPRRAGVNAFGISGTNSHVVVEGYTDTPAAEDSSGAGENRLLPLSGKTGEALRDLAQRYLSWLDERAR